MPNQIKSESNELFDQIISQMEDNRQSLSMEMLTQISGLLYKEQKESSHLENPNTLNIRIHGGKPLSGEIEVKTSKNAAVGLLCASLLNKGTTTLRNLARIEEVNRIIEVLTSLGVQIQWLNDQNDLEIKPPERLLIENLNMEAARKTRSIIMFLGPLLHVFTDFELPYAGGCNLGKRTVKPHLDGLKHFGLEVDASQNGLYKAHVNPCQPKKPIVMIERGDTVTENILMAAALCTGTTIIRNASPNYMVQDLCLFLQQFGVKIEGIGTTTLKVTGIESINQNVEYYPSEDPIEAMSLLAAGIVTKSQITIRRVPIEFLEIELLLLEEMGLQYEMSEEYVAHNGYTRLVDLEIKPSELTAPKDKIHPLPFPGINIDNLPFFACIAATAHGRTLVHDWVYENRAIYLTELTKLNAKVELLDPHRVYIEGPTRWKSAEVICPPALRPSVVILLGMLAAKGTSTLRNTYSIARGYEDLVSRLNLLGAEIEIFGEN
ncbi:UDP-N-acetylglucosamine 1-carboxyvinyltransferase [Croceifilum oryzae]|uniref:UDP-N-acetylglucosamine 1-carboxyvinyltransferase n=1 Tax=Croceifilum oryzae TaxID=1553429 RepID=A0AAJ1TJQ3_9BACL|nr:UDP-N-acetylglucosamine 1-carboxyvinyltransferase [Croceifilum oryzae]MDQ0417381.1 UDP-N-acetylglucosamine 1-carboxyvinyltransferase [Croceifilum oryzae]